MLTEMYKNCSIEIHRNALETVIYVDDFDSSVQLPANISDESALKCAHGLIDLLLAPAA